MCFLVKKTWTNLCCDRKQIHDSREFLPSGCLKRYRFNQGIELSLIYWPSMHSGDLIVKKFFPLCHFDVYLGFGDVLIRCPCLGAYSWDWSSLHWLDHVSLSPVMSGQFLRSQSLMLYHDCASTTGFAISCSHVSGQCCTGKWSRDLGVLRDLKINLGNTCVTYTKKFIANFMFLMFCWTQSWVPDDLLPMQRFLYTPL